MDDFIKNNPFPFNCQTGGLAYANTAASPIIFPYRKTNAVVQFGTAPASPPASSLSDLVVRNTR